MLKPICVPCQRFFRMRKSGVYIIEGMPIGNGVPPGKSFAEKWKPYKLWAVDRWECPECGVAMLFGSGQTPISEHYKPEFAETAKQLNATYQVNDC